MEKWQKDIVEREKNLNTNQLLDAVILSAVVNGYVGLHYKYVRWEFEYLRRKLYQRLNFTIP